MRGLLVLDPIRYYIVDVRKGHVGSARHAGSDGVAAAERTAPQHAPARRLPFIQPIRLDILILIILVVIFDEL